MITLEKMLVLKTIPFFKSIPDDILLLVAGVLREKTVAAGELILQKGDLGNTMYIIVTGKVKVHDGDKTLAVLGEREVVGELAALSSEERIASVSAMEDTLLLNITQPALYDLMELHVGLAKEIINVLCQRVRTIAVQRSI